KSLADAWADTITPHGKLIPTVLGRLAEYERTLIKARTDEGRKRAQARGQKFGRRPKLTEHQRREALARREAGEPLIETGRSYNVSHSRSRGSEPTQRAAQPASVISACRGLCMISLLWKPSPPPL